VIAELAADSRRKHNGKHYTPAQASTARIAHFLKRRKVGRVFQYVPKEGRNKVISRLIGQFLDKVLDGSAGRRFETRITLSMYVFSP